MTGFFVALHTQTGCIYSESKPSQLRHMPYFLVSRSKFGII